MVSVVVTSVVVVVSSVPPGIRVFCRKVLFNAQEEKFTRRGRNVKVYASHSI